MSMPLALRGGALVLLLGLIGCSSPARVVTIEPGRGTVAIPENTNHFPDYYRDRAEDLIREKAPYGYTIEKEEEVKVGTETRAASAGSLNPFKNLILGGRVESSETFDKTEWRITFRANLPPSGPAATQGNAVQPASATESAHQ